MGKAEGTARERAEGARGSPSEQPLLEKIAFDWTIGGYRLAVAKGGGTTPRVGDSGAVHACPAKDRPSPSPAPLGHARSVNPAGEEHSRQEVTAQSRSVEPRAIGPVCARPDFH